MCVRGRMPILRRDRSRRGGGRRARDRMLIVSRARDLQQVREDRVGDLLDARVVELDRDRPGEIGLEDETHRAAVDRVERIERLETPRAERGEDAPAATLDVDER